MGGRVAHLPYVHPRDQLLEVHFTHIGALRIQVPAIKLMGLFRELVKRREFKDASRSSSSGTPYYMTLVIAMANDRLVI